MLLEEAASKCEHIAGEPLRPSVGQSKRGAAHRRQAEGLAPFRAPGNTLARSLEAATLPRMGPKSVVLNGKLHG